MQFIIIFHPTAPHTTHADKDYEYIPILMNQNYNLIFEENILSCESVWVVNSSEKRVCMVVVLFHYTGRQLTMEGRKMSRPYLSIVSFSHPTK